MEISSHDLWLIEEITTDVFKRKARNEVDKEVEEEEEEYKSKSKQ